MNSIIITTPSELENLIQKSVNKALTEFRTVNEPDSTAESVGNPFKQSSPHYMNIHEASAYTHQAVQTIYAKCSDKLIPYIKRGRRNLFLKSDLDKWLMEGKQRSVAEIKEDLIKSGKL